MPPISVQDLDILRFQGKTKSAIEKAINIIFSKRCQGKCYFNDSVVYTKHGPFSYIPKAEHSIRKIDDHKFLVTINRKDPRTSLGVGGEKIVKIAWEILLGDEEAKLRSVAIGKYKKLCTEPNREFFEDLPSLTYVESTKNYYHRVGGGSLRKFTYNQLAFSDGDFFFLNAPIPKQFHEYLLLCDSIVAAILELRGIGAHYPDLKLNNLLIMKVDGSSDFRVVFGDINTIRPDSSFGLCTVVPPAFRKRIIQNILNRGGEVNDTSFDEERRRLVRSGGLVWDEEAILGLVATTFTFVALEMTYGEVVPKRAIDEFWATLISPLLYGFAPQLMSNVSPNRLLKKFNDYIAKNLRESIPFKQPVTSDLYHMRHLLQMLASSMDIARVRPLVGSLSPLNIVSPCDPETKAQLFLAVERVKSFALKYRHLGKIYFDDKVEPYIKQFYIPDIRGEHSFLALSEDRAIIDLNRKASLLGKGCYSKGKAVWLLKVGPLGVALKKVARFIDIAPHGIFRRWDMEADDFKKIRGVDQVVRRFYLTSYQKIKRFHITKLTATDFLLPPLSKSINHNAAIICRQILSIATEIHAAGFLYGTFKERSLLVVMPKMIQNDRPQVFLRASPRCHRIGTVFSQFRPEYLPPRLLKISIDKFGSKLGKKPEVAEFIALYYNDEECRSFTVTVQDESSSAGMILAKLLLDRFSLPQEKKNALLKVAYDLIGFLPEEIPSDFSGYFDQIYNHVSTSEASEIPAEGNISISEAIAQLDLIG